MCAELPDRFIKNERKVVKMLEKQLPQSLGELLRQLDEQKITDYRRYKMVKRFLDSKARKKGVPFSGNFELTPLCNLDCKMCYVHLNKEQMMGKELLTVQQWKSLMNQAVEHGMMYANLTGGECLTYSGFKELYLYLRSKGVETSILSNGILIDEEMIDFLKKNKPAVIQITIYGASEEGYERVTGHRCFSMVMDHIKRLIEAQIPVSVVTTPSEFMTDGKQIIDLMYALGMPMIINAGLMVPRKETGRMLSAANLDAYVDMMKHRQVLYGNKMDDIIEPEELPDTGGNGEGAFGVLCGAGRSSFFIDWCGIMKPCGNFPCKGESVLELGFAKAWKMTHDIAVHFPQPVECQGCKYQSVCKHCVAEHAAGAPCGHASPNICAWGQRLVSERLLKLPVLEGTAERRKMHEENI